MVSLATMGKFWPQAGYELSWPKDGGSNYAGGVWERKLPVVIIDAIKEKDEKISVIITGVEDD